MKKILTLITMLLITTVAFPQQPVIVNNSGSTKAGTLKYDPATGLFYGRNKSGWQLLGDATSSSVSAKVVIADSSATRAGNYVTKKYLTTNLATKINKADSSLTGEGSYVTKKYYTTNLPKLADTSSALRALINSVEAGLDTTGVNLVSNTLYTIIAADMGDYIQCNNSDTIYIKIPSNNTVPFKIGSKILFEQTGAGKIKVAGVGGVTLHGYAGLVSPGQWAVIGIIKTATNVWNLFNY